MKYLLRDGSFSDEVDDLRGIVQLEGNIIQLPDDNITSSQYSALRHWVSSIIVVDSVSSIEVVAPDVYPVRYYFNDPEIDADYIVNRIRRYYITGNLYEAYKDPADR